MLVLVTILVTDLPSAAVALLVSHENISDKWFLKRVARYVKLVDDEFATQIRELIRHMSDSPESVASTVGRKGMDFDDGSAGIAGFILSSVLWGFYCFLKHKNSYWDAVCEVIAGGGDTDSTSALVGCLSGSYLGIFHIIESVPTLVCTYLASLLIFSGVHDTRQRRVEDA